MKMFEVIKGIFGKKATLKHVTLDGVRIHLNIKERKMWINGYYVLRLNRSATDLLEAFIDACYEVPPNRVVERAIAKMGRAAKRSVLEQDLQQLVGIINEFAKGKIPCHLVGVKNVTEQKSAPNRMDVSITYTCNNRCPHCYLPSNKDPAGTLTTEQWKQVIDKLWSLGIPQIVYSGGECTQQADKLVELVAHAKQFVTGIISNGTLVTKQLAVDLRKAELDWIQITLNSHKGITHDQMEGRPGAYDETLRGIRNSITAGIVTNVNMTLTQKNKDDLPALIDLCKKLGVSQVSTNALINSGRGSSARNLEGIPEAQLQTILENGKKHAAKVGIDFNWYLPTCYHNFNPESLGFGTRNCSACSVNLMIEPDGQVIPCQSWTQNKLGNILKNDWESIWNNPLAVQIRQHAYAAQTCKSCEHFRKCGGACPLETLNAGKSLRTCGGMQK